MKNNRYRKKHDGDSSLSLYCDGFFGPLRDMNNSVPLNKMKIKNK